MLRIETLCLGELQANCYLVSRPESADTVVIDPGDDLAALKSALRGRTVAGVLITHAHYDHIQGLPALSGAPVYVHEADAAAMTDAVLNCAKENLPRVPATHTLREDEIVSLAGLDFTVLHTPGHTPGSVCFRCEDALFSGDTLFAHGYGRVDLPGGSWHQLLASLRRLLRLPQSLTLYPGHGESAALDAVRGRV